MLVWMIVLSSLWILVDAKKIGVRRGLLKGLGNVGPWGWFIGSLLLWIIFFPLYLFYRGKYKASIVARAKTEDVSAGLKLSEDQSESQTEKGAAQQGDTDKRQATQKEGKKNASRGEILTAVVIIGGILYFGIADDIATQNSPGGKSASASASDCKSTDLQCLGDAGTFSAPRYCKSKIEEMALHDYKWTDGTL